MNQNSDNQGAFLKGLASATMLGGLLFGLPLLLIFGVGWPLPQSIPSGSETLDAIKAGAIPSSFVSKSVAVVLWILWLQLFAGVVVELWAHFHGRLAPQVAFIPRIIQSMSARIIGTVLAISFSIHYPSLAMADNQDLLSPTVVEMDLHYEDPAQRLSANDPQENSLRPIAERYLGDSDRWTEVYVLSDEDPPSVVQSPTYPAQGQLEWELLMPVAEGPPEPVNVFASNTGERENVADPPPPESSSTRVTVQEGDTLWGLANLHLDDPERWVDIYNLNRNIIQDPNLIMPGWELDLPAPQFRIQLPLFTEATAPQPAASPIEPLPESIIEPDVEPSIQLAIAPTVQPESESSVEWNRDPIPVAAYTTPKPVAVAKVPAVSENHESTPTTQTMFTIGGLGLFASSLGWVVARLRRNQRRRLPNGRMPVSLTREAIQLEQQLQDFSDSENALFLDACLRVMSSRFTGQSPPHVIGVSFQLDAVSVHLTTPAAPPRGFEASDDKMVWTLSRSEELEDLFTEAEGVPAPLPTLITLGKLFDNEYFLNLEHMTALSLQGDPAAIADLCAAIAVQLASSHLADDLTVICVGFGQDLSVLERVEYVPDVVAATSRIAYHDRQNRALLGSHLPSVDTRIGHIEDYWHPVVALVPDQLTEQESHNLLEASGCSVCIVAHGLVETAWLGRFDEAGLLLEPINLRLEPQGFSGAVVSAVAELATTSKDPQGVVLEMPVTPQSSVSIFEGEQRPTAVEVRVLGTVDVLGAAYPFSSRRALDLVAYLAFHPDGADRDQLRAHLWPSNDPPSESAFANTVTRARKALGTDADGNSYLPRVGPKGIYRLRPEVGTDVTRFETLVSAAGHDPGGRGREHLQAALDLVRGTPFTGGAGDIYRWADFGIRTRIDYMVDTVAHELAKRCMEAGDPEGTRRAVATSLRLVGVCEQCYRWRFLAAAGNPTELRQIMAELVGVLKRENNQPEADDLISPNLMKLYEQLMSDCTEFS